MVDSSTTSALIINMIGGNCWAWCQLHNSEWLLLVGFSLWKSLSCAGCIRYQAYHILLISGYLHSWETDFDSVCRGLLGFTPASQLYKVCRYGITTPEFTAFYGGCIRYEYQLGDILLDGTWLHNWEMDFDSVCGRLFGSLPASESQGLRFLHLEFLFMILEGLG